SFYIKGSAFADYKVRIELWLGQKDAPVGGVAMFDNVRIEEITAKEYTDYSSNSKRVTFDPGAESNIISNGYFDEIESYDDYSLQPFAPASWTLMTAGEDKTTGMSTFVNDADYRDWCVSGIVSSNANSYKYEKQDGSYLEGGISPKTNSISSIPSNVLMIKADESTNAPDSGVAVGYKSTSFSFSANTVQTISVNMKAVDINGYGANLVLKNGNDVIASIEKIQDTSGYEDFLFCVQTGDTDLSEVYVEIWLGLYDRVNNLSKLSTGTLFVDNVVLKNESEGDTDASMLYLGYYLNYENELKQGLNPKYATYSSAKMDFNAFDRYSNETIKTAYGWTESRIASNDGDGAVTYGVFTADEYDKNANGDLPQGYKHEGAVNRHSLIIKNNSPASSRIKCDTKFNLKSNSYYVVTILAKVDIPTNQLAQDYKGAYIGIVDSEHAISDIKSTNTVESIYDTEADDQSYKAFKFYIKTADDITIEDDDEEEDDESTKTSDTADTIISFEFGIGGSAENKNEWAVGALMINDISIEICSNTEYEEVKDSIDNGGILTSRFNAIVNYADDGKEEEEDKKEEENISGNISGDNWYLYTTVILAVILIIVLVSVAVRRYAQKRRREKEEEPEATLSYDRRNTLVPQHNERAEEKDIVKLSDSDIYDSFDENENYEYVDDTIEVEETQTESPAPANETAEKVEETVEEIVEEVVAPETSNEMQEETAENATEEVDEEYTYSEEIIDFTPSEEKKKILEAQRAEAERIKAAKAEAKKRAEAERIKAETERRLASRTQNDWDRFDE
ncbi:MAG: hypothetical protein IKM44_03995, partial [Clostridia bacterium]|nr:hypothetical protein [Clostridia bacterium]